jgi:hypothetical protein
MVTWSSSNFQVRNLGVLSRRIAIDMMTYELLGRKAGGYIADFDNGYWTR